MCCVIMWDGKTNKEFNKITLFCEAILDLFMTVTHRTPPR